MSYSAAINAQQVMALHTELHRPNALSTCRPRQPPASLKGHRLNDQMSSLISAPMTAADVLNMTSAYTYDSLAV